MSEALSAVCTPRRRHLARGTASESGPNRRFVLSRGRCRAHAARANEPVHYLRSVLPMIRSALVFLLVALWSTRLDAVEISLSGANSPETPTLVAAPGGVLTLSVELINRGATDASLRAAQVALVVRRLDDSSATAPLNLAATKTSLFGVAATPVPNGSLSIVTAQTGSLIGATLSTGSRDAFADFEVAFSPDSSGIYEVVALAFSPLSPLLSSQWTPTPASPTPFAAPLAYSNANASTGGQVLLGLITVVVPEASGVWLVLPVTGALLSRRL